MVDTSDFVALAVGVEFYVSTDEQQREEKTVWIKVSNCLAYRTTDHALCRFVGDEPVEKLDKPE